MKIGIILGTRPEIIKFAPLIKLFSKKKVNYFVIHTNQHYSYNMDRIFFKELRLPQPKYNLGVGSGTHGQQTGSMLEKIEPVLMKEKPDVVLVEGDTNTVLAGALAASKLGIAIGHVEAGLRSYDRRMPEETNRIITDHISSLLFVPTENSRKNLLKEGIDKKKIFITGNTIVDSVKQNIGLIKSKKKEKKDYFLITLHRTENVDHKEILSDLVHSILLVMHKYQTRLIWPIHPRTKKQLKKFNLLKKLEKNKLISLVEPVGYFEFLELEKNASLIITDSGGIQEEACILKVPCITMRDNTERPETLTVGANVLIGSNPKKIVPAANLMLKKKRKWKIPFGKGNTSEIMLNILKRHYGK
jgi:UDP-N-acetylglucosamine 2-epimerase (non-hydrolysing)